MTPKTRPGRYIEGCAKIRPRSARVKGRYKTSAPVFVTLVLKKHTEGWGGDPAVLSHIKAFAKRAHLHVESSHLESRMVVLSGTIGALAAAFGVKFKAYQVGKAVHRGYLGRISIPDGLHSSVVAVLGLDTFPAVVHARRRPPARRRSARAKGRIAALTTTKTSRATRYPLRDIASAHSFPTNLSGKEQCIGIIALGGSYNRDDLTQFFDGRLPEIVDVPVDGGAKGSIFEATCDVEVVGSLAPNARIAVYIAPNTFNGWLHAINKAVTDSDNKPSVLSMSYSRWEEKWPQELIDAFGVAFKAAAAANITVIASAGDESGGVNYPAADPYVLACGGTEATIVNGKLTAEKAWDNTNGGISARLPAPDWQSPNDVPDADDGSRKRGLPDVSANAVGYDCYAGGAPFAFGGTSGAAALWAALMGLVNEGLGRSAGLISPLLYQQPRACCRDVVKGSNSDTDAVKGWDACTGWGSPNGTGLLDTLRAHRAALPPSGSTHSGADMPARETFLTGGKRTTPRRRARPR